jgi:proline iminopeptidase
MKKIILSISTGTRAIYQSDPKGLPELYCIHGGMGLGSDSLMTSLRPLAEIYDLTFIDLRGCGNSDKAHDDQYTLSNFSNDIIEIVKAVSKGDKRGIFGHSFGGMVAIDLLSHSDLFHFAILANTALNDKCQVASREAVKQLDELELKKSLAAYQEAPNDISLRNLAITYGPIYFPELEKHNAKETMSNFNYCNEAMSFTSEKVYPGMNLLDQVKTIGIPSLVISGSDDIIVPSSNQEELAGHLKKSVLKTIKNAGHFPFITKNNDFISSIKNWWHDTHEVIK